MKHSPHKLRRRSPFGTEYRSTPPFPHHTTRPPPHHTTRKKKVIIWIRRVAGSAWNRIL